MENSPSSIRGIDLVTLTTIRRRYYPGTLEECPLCSLGQPLVRIQSESDFATIHDEQLTPLDFWELVRDSGALRRGEEDAQHRRFAYRVETRALLARYNRWLANVVRHKAKRAWRDRRPGLICTVDEPSSLAFAELVRQAIGPSEIVAISRDLLRRATPAGGHPTGYENPIRPKHLTVLLVDDGINFGDTLRSLVTLCNAAGNPLLGALVLDSRLEERAANGIRKQMGNAPLVALYTWPTVSDNLM